MIRTYRQSYFTCNGKQHYFKKDEKKRNVLKTVAAPLNVENMYSSARCIPRICHDWENMELNVFQFLLTKEMHV